MEGAQGPVQGAAAAAAAAAGGGCAIASLSQHKGAAASSWCSAPYVLGSIADKRAHIPAAAILAHVQVRRLIWQRPVV
jgi:hypothetical protein